jgi:hypothetical protein
MHLALEQTDGNFCAAARLRGVADDFIRSRLGRKKKSELAPIPIGVAKARKNLELVPSRIKPRGLG